MEFINTVFGIPLGYLMYACYALVKNYGVAIILFTLVSKAVLFPVSLAAQKNSIRMVKIQPALDEAKQRFAGDKDRIAEEQLRLYKEEKYSPALGCLPTLIQIPIILGLINVIYNPLQHLLHLSADTIARLTAVTEGLAGQALGIGAQLRIIDAVHNPANLPVFKALGSTLPDIDTTLAAIEGMDISFLGLNLGSIPWGSGQPVLWLVPIISGLSALLMCLIQNRINVLQREQGAFGKWGMTVFLVIFSAYFPIIVPVGVGLYWIASNLLSILVMVLVNVVYPPEKYIDYASRPKKVVLTAAERREQKQLAKENRAREKADVQRFYATPDKQLVFYSVRSGFYKYFENVIDFLLRRSELVIHYVTSDPNDAIFKKNEPRIIPYYVGDDKSLIPFMMKMDADMVVMTMPDLQQFHIKRSLVREDVEYVYMFHAFPSMHMTLREGALDHYDTVFCAGPHHVRELRRSEEVYHTPKKRLVEAGYGLFDTLLEQYKAMPPRPAGRKPQIVIGPSWQPGNILESCIDEMVDALVCGKYRVILRPHPESFKRFPDKMQALIDRFKDRTDEDFIIETDFSSNASIYESDMMITDWSNIAFEFSYCTKKPCVFINTPMKVMNPNYEKLGIEPIEITLRERVGVSLPPDGLEPLAATVADMLASHEEWAGRLTDVFDEYLYNPGKSGAVGGTYIMRTLAAKHPQGKEAAQ